MKSIWIKLSLLITVFNFANNVYAKEEKVMCVFGLQEYCADNKKWISYPIDFGRHHVILSHGHDSWFAIADKNIHKPQAYAYNPSKKTAQVFQNSDPKNPELLYTFTGIELPTTLDGESHKIIYIDDPINYPQSYVGLDEQTQTVVHHTHIVAPAILCAPESAFKQN